MASMTPEDAAAAAQAAADTAKTAAETATEAATAAQGFADQAASAAGVIGDAAHAATGIDPFVFRLAIFGCSVTVAFSTRFVMSMGFGSSGFGSALAAFRG